MIFFATLLSIGACAIALTLFPSFPLLFAAPLCCLCLQQKGKITSFWVAASCGLIFDLLIFDSTFGLYSLCYTVALVIVSLIDKPLIKQTLPLLTGFFSIAFWILSFLIFQNGFSMIPFLIMMPLVDSFYAFLWFTLPLQLRKNRGKKVHTTLRSIY